jgi:glycosyltransferase involved in cell wall biosynthesis
MNAQPHLLIVVNVDAFFLSHRLPIALAARDAGMRVSIAARDTGEGRRIRDLGLDFHPLDLSQGGMNPAREAASVWRLARLYRRLRPDLVHQVTIKPVLYGSLAARLAGGISIINAVSGLGYAFSQHGKARLLHPLVHPLYRLAMAGEETRAIFQNPDDRALFLRAGIVDERRTVLIRGSGVDAAVFRATPEPEKPLLLLPSRMIWDKGVAEFVEAARRIRARRPDVRFALVGRPDPGNPKAIDEAQLRAWRDAGVVEWWGHRSDMPEVLASASAVVLPTTYCEGVPKVLIEAAAAGRPIVTTDAPGCREIVRDGVNGLLVPPGDNDALVGAIERLLADAQMRRHMGAAGARIAAEEFSLAGVVERHLELYRELLGVRPAAPGCIIHEASRAA